MKQINFVNPVPPHIKKEVRRWMVLHMVCVTGVGMYIVISIAVQGYLYYSLSSQRTSLDQTSYTTLMQKQKEIHETDTIQTHKLTKLKTYQTNPKNPVALLMAYSQQIGSAHIQSCSITPRSCEVTYSSPTMQFAQKKLQDMQSIPGIQNVQLVSLQRQNNSFISTMRAERNKKRADRSRLS